MAFRYGPGPIFDVFTGAVAGYSLRRLSSSYTGSLLRVRRDSDNTETDIGFYRYTIDENAIANFAGNSSLYVKTWYDQSGNNRHISQSNLALQPLIASSGSYLSYLNFAGAISLNASSAFSVFGPSNEMTFIDVHKPSIDTAFSYPINWGGSLLGNYPGGSGIRFYTPSTGNDCFTFPINNKWAILLYATRQGGTSGDGIQQYTLARANGANGSLTGASDGYGIWRDQWLPTTFTGLGASMSGTSNIQRREFIIYNYTQPYYRELEQNINSYYRLY